MSRPKKDYTEIKEALDKGLSKKDICSKFGIHGNTLRYILRTRGWQPTCIEPQCRKLRWLNSKRCPEHAESHRATYQLSGNLPESQKLIRAGYNRTYFTGFTPEMFLECWELQKGLCGLCDTELNTLGSAHIHADHVPNSMPPKPRGILCNRCNTHWLGKLEDFERQGDCKITNPQLLEWQTNPPMSKSSFAIELGWKPALTDKEN